MILGQFKTEAEALAACGPDDYAFYSPTDSSWYSARKLQWLTLDSTQEERDAARRDRVREIAAPSQGPSQQ